MLRISSQRPVVDGGRDVSGGAPDDGHSFRPRDHDTGEFTQLGKLRWRLRRLSARIGIISVNDPQADGHAISAAVEESVSSTGAAHRGRGLAQMRDFVDQCRGGYLKIMSRYGEVTFRPGEATSVRSHSTSVGGTLIEWNVVL